MKIAKFLGPFLYLQQVRLKKEQSLPLTEKQKFDPQLFNLPSEREKFLQLLRIFLKSLKIDRVSLDLYSSPETRNILYGFVTSKTISND